MDPNRAPRDFSPDGEGLEDGAGGGGGAPAGGGGGPNAGGGGGGAGLGGGGAFGPGVGGGGGGGFSAVVVGEVAIVFVVTASEASCVTPSSFSF